MVEKSNDDFDVFMKDHFNIVKKTNEFTFKINNDILNVDINSFIEHYNTYLNEELIRKLNDKENKKSKKDLEIENISVVKKTIVYGFFDLINNVNFNDEKLEEYLDVIKKKIKPEILILILWSQKKEDSVLKLFQKKPFNISGELYDVFHSVFELQINTFKANFPINSEEKKLYIQEQKEILIFTANKYYLLHDLNNNLNCHKPKAHSSLKI